MHVQSTGALMFMYLRFSQDNHNVQKYAGQHGKKKDANGECYSLRLTASEELESSGSTKTATLPSQWQLVLALLPVQVMLPEHTMPHLA